MTTLERLALQVSARLTGDDLVLVLDYAAALTRETRLDTLQDALAVVIRSQTSSATFAAADAVREMIAKEAAHE